LLTVMTLVTGAKAAVVVQDLFTLAPGDSGSFLRFTAGPLAAGEIVRFQVSSPAKIDATGINIVVPPMFGIGDFDFDLVQGLGSVADPFSTFAVLALGAPFGGALTLSFATLAVGVQYGLLFSGDIGGDNTGPFGLYAGSYSLSAVPLPPAAWLFLSALLGLAGVVRHRRKPMAPAGQE